MYRGGGEGDTRGFRTPIYRANFALLRRGATTTTMKSAVNAFLIPALLRDCSRVTERREFHGSLAALLFSVVNSKFECSLCHKIRKVPQRVLCYTLQIIALNTVKYFYEIAVLSSISNKIIPTENPFARPREL